MQIQKTKTLTWMALFLQFILLLTLGTFNVQLDYTSMSVMAIACTVIDVALLKILCELPVISIPNIFAYFSLMFHCGQLIKEGFNIAGTVPLPFEYYGDSDTIQKSFAFFVLSQTVYYAGVVMFHGQKGQKQKWKSFDAVDILTYAKVLIAVGIIPHLYIDILSLLGAMSGGYEGVYSLYFPQAIQSIAFFFDAGLFFLLFGLRRKATQRMWFLLIIVYKCVMMSTGARQEKVAFLLVWIYIYFFVLNKITLGKLFFLAAACVVGFMFISAIGTIRSSDTVSLGQTLMLIQSGTMTNILGGALGEFGSTFDTLEVAVKYTPSQIDYGYGRSYLAGACSVIPLLVNRIPFLSETVMFVSQLPRNITFALGGSFLGELYYNFSWFGVLGSAIVGSFMSRLHTGIIIKSDSESRIIYQVWCSILATAMILFVRGYFTDMVQKLIWTYGMICLVRVYVLQKSNRKVST